MKAGLLFYLSLGTFVFFIPIICRGYMTGGQIFFLVVTLSIAYNGHAMGDLSQRRHSLAGERIESNHTPKAPTDGPAPFKLRRHSFVGNEAVQQQVQAIGQYMPYEYTDPANLYAEGMWRIDGGTDVALGHLLLVGASCKKFAPAQFQLARRYLQAGKPEEAKKHLEEILRTPVAQYVDEKTGRTNVSVTYPPARYLLGKLYAEEKFGKKKKKKGIKLLHACAYKQKYAPAFCRLAELAKEKRERASDVRLDQRMRLDHALDMGYVPALAQWQQYYGKQDESVADSVMNALLDMGMLYVSMSEEKPLIIDEYRALDDHEYGERIRKAYRDGYDQEAVFKVLSEGCKSKSNELPAIFAFEGLTFLGQYATESMQKKVAEEIKDLAYQENAQACWYQVKKLVPWVYATDIKKYNTPENKSNLADAKRMLAKVVHSNYRKVDAQKLMRQVCYVRGLFAKEEKDYARASAAWQEAVEQGHEEAMLEQVELLLNGKNPCYKPEQALNQSLGMLKKVGGVTGKRGKEKLLALEEINPDDFDCMRRARLGLAQLYGVSDARFKCGALLKQDVPFARACVKDLARAGSRAAIQLEGLLFLQPPADIDKAVACLEKAGQMGEPDSYGQLIHILFDKNRIDEALDKITYCCQRYAHKPEVLQKIFFEKKIFMRLREYLENERAACIFTSLCKQINETPQLKMVVSQDDIPLLDGFSAMEALKVYKDYDQAISFAMRALHGSQYHTEWACYMVLILKQALLGELKRRSEAGEPIEEFAKKMKIFDRMVEHKGISITYDGETV